MYTALIVGCGNIGALYDIETEAINSYAKAFHQDPEIAFDVYDINPDNARRVADLYHVQCLSHVDPEIYGRYDMVVISTPTETHYEYLCGMLERGPRLVICEKPVDIDRERLGELIGHYGQSASKVMVNFFRRFQPGFIQLRQEIEDILKTEKCTNIVVTYQRGFHNNASHAVDLLEFLFGAKIDIGTATISHRAEDEFDFDPTLSMACVWQGANLQFVGLAWAQFSHFEISIYFTRKAILLRDGGNQVELLAASAASGRFYPRLGLQSRRTGVTDDFMVPVVDHAKGLLKDENLGDNFLESVGISDRILELQGR